MNATHTVAQQTLKLKLNLDELQIETADCLSDCELNSHSHHPIILIAIIALIIASSAEIMYDSLALPIEIYIHLHCEGGGCCFKFKCTKGCKKNLGTIQSSS